jgi:hypothetical protein
MQFRILFHRQSLGGYHHGFRVFLRNFPVNRNTAIRAGNRTQSTASTSFFVFQQEYRPVTFAIKIAG